MKIEQELIAALRALHVEQQREVLDFATFLMHKSHAVSERRPFGLCAGEFRVPEDFDAPLPNDVLDAFNA
jgi:hypothetical protein